MLNKTSNLEQRVSGIGGKAGEIEDMLSVMREENELLEEKQASMKMAPRRLEEEKVKVGNNLMERTMKRKRDEVMKVEEVEDKEEETPTMNKRELKREEYTGEKDGELEKFGKYLAVAYLARVTLERKKLAFGREKLEKEM